MLATVRSLFGASAKSYSRHGGRMLSAAVAFSTLLSIAPLLFIALGFASVAVGNARSRDSVMHDLGRWIGADAAQTIFSLLERAGEGTSSGPARVIGAIVLVYASTRMFSQMKRALDHMWDIHPKSGVGWKGKVWKQLRKRGLSLLMVLFVGVLIIAVVIVKTILAASTSVLGDAGSQAAFRGGEMIVSLVTTTLMFGALFKFLPDARLHWRDALRGALVTSVLFAIGTTIIGLYLGHKTLDILYGPGGSLVMLLLWVHYSAQVFFFGAAVTGELARRGGRTIEPDDNGVRIVIADAEA